MTDDVIELCVSAQAREGEANKAVVKLLSEVSGGSSHGPWVGGVRRGV